jgi:hypothetical protein
LYPQFGAQAACPKGFSAAAVVATRAWVAVASAALPHALNTIASTAKRITTLNIFLFNILSSYHFLLVFELKSIWRHTSFTNENARHPGNALVGLKSIRAFPS